MVHVVNMTQFMDDDVIDHFRRCHGEAVIKGQFFVPAARPILWESPQCRLTWASPSAPVDNVQSAVQSCVYTRQNKTFSDLPAAPLRYILLPGLSPAAHEPCQRAGMPPFPLFHIPWPEGRPAPLCIRADLCIISSPCCITSQLNQFLACAVWCLNGDHIGRLHCYRGFFSFAEFNMTCNHLSLDINRKHDVLHFCKLSCLLVLQIVTQYSNVRYLYKFIEYLCNNM